MQGNHYKEQDIQKRISKKMGKSSHLWILEVGFLFRPSSLLIWLFLVFSLISKPSSLLLFFCSGDEGPANWADPSFVRKKKIARAQLVGGAWFGEEGARDPAASWRAGQLPFSLRQAGTRWTTWASGGLFPLSLEGGPGGFLLRVAAG